VERVKFHDLQALFVLLEEVRVLFEELLGTFDITFGEDDSEFIHSSGFRYVQR